MLNNIDDFARQNCGVFRDYKEKLDEKVRGLKDLQNVTMNFLKTEKVDAIIEAKEAKTQHLRNAAREVIEPCQWGPQQGLVQGGY